MNLSGASLFAQELQTPSWQQHRFMLQLMGACIDPRGHAGIVTVFLSSTLREWLHEPGNRRKSERAKPLPPFGERLSLSLEIARGMKNLQEQKPKVVPRDMKPSNIFLDNAMHGILGMPGSWEMKSWH
ncbi:hypothetical protein BT93_B2751 [Corymbia citriodora subsp. variegata]|nr:hypothetical protein BT93_B2751 [Corymbia citriodora subsp. variegata]